MKAELLKFQEKRQLQLFARKYGPSYVEKILKKGAGGKKISANYQGNA